MAELVKVAMKSDVSPEKIKAVDVNGQKIAICQTGDSYYAVGDICSHAKEFLDHGQIIGDQIECPKHGARFDVKSGAAMCLPAVTPVPSYRVEIKGEELWVAIPENS